MASATGDASKVASVPSPVKTIDGPVPLVLITGVTGYVGSWCAATLLEAGYRVRGTARSLSSKKLDPVRALPGASDRLEVVTADLMQPTDKWVEAMEGVDYVLHVASPFFFSDKEEDLVGPALQGTRGVLLAARKSKTVKRIVLTASMASIMYGHGNLNKKTWTPDDHSVPDGPDIDAYCKSKTLAEEEAWRIVRGEGDYKKDGPASYDLVTIHPGMILGPVLGNIGKFTSMDLLLRILDGNSLVDGGMPSVDVRDVARAHVLAMITPEAGGKRLITTHSAVDFLSMQRALAKEFNDKGYSVSTGITPSWLINCVACCVPDAARAQTMIGKFPQVDNSATSRILGLTFTEQLQSYVDMAHSAIQHGYTADKSKDKSLSRVQPSLMAPFVQGLRIKSAGGGAASGTSGAAAGGGGGK